MGQTPAISLVKKPNVKKPRRRKSRRRAPNGNIRKGTHFTILLRNGRVLRGQMIAKVRGILMLTLSRERE
jgi:hypothetical protein